MSIIICNYFIKHSDHAHTVTHLMNVICKLSQEMYIPRIDWEDSGYVDDPHTGVNVPLLDSPLTAEQMEQLMEHINPLQPSESFGIDLFLDTVQYVQGVVGETL